MSVYKLTTGNVVDVEITKGAPFTVAVTPAAGDTVAVSFGLGSGNWYAWDAGPVTAQTIRTVRSAVKTVRFQRTAGSSVNSIGEIY